MTGYFKRKAEEYRSLDQADRRHYWVDVFLNNALYILMAAFIIFTAVVNKNFLSPSSIANIITPAAGPAKSSLAAGPDHRLGRPFERGGDLHRAGSPRPALHDGHLGQLPGLHGVRYP